MRKSWIIRGGVRASQKVGAVCIEAWRHENANRVAGKLVWLQPGALEASGDKLGDMDREQAWCSSFQSYHLQLEGSSYKVIPILVLLFQISHGPHGLGVKPTLQNQHSRPFLISPLPTSLNLSSDAPCEEEKAGLSYKPSPISVLG